MGSRVMSLTDMTPNCMRSLLGANYMRLHVIRPGEAIYSRSGPRGTKGSAHASRCGGMMKSSNRPRIRESEMPMARPLNEVKAELFKGLAHPLRIRILELLAAEREIGVSQILDATQLEPSHL